MEWAELIYATNALIDRIAWVVVPTEILLLTLISRRIIFNDAYTNIGCGLTIIAYFKLTGGGFALPCLQLLETYQIHRIEINCITVVLHLLVGDLCFYVFHRAAHTPLLFLLDHSVHHSSKSLDYSTNLRISFIAPIYAWFPLIVPVLVGFDLPLLLACFALSNAVPFFMHNTHTPKLGWAEWIFNTPSHHRVHHGTNAIYINKNFGGLFIIWDRLFGTYAEETEKPVFGAKGFESPKNPIKVLTQGWVKAYHQVGFKQAPGKALNN